MPVDQDLRRENVSENTGKSNAHKNVSRRNFFKGTAALIGAGVIVDSKLNAAQTQKPEAAANAASVRLAGYCGEEGWLGTPPVIPDAQITKTVDIDVLVLGGGHAGVLAALGASDKGAKVAVIEGKDEAGFKTDYMHRVGEDIGHVNSSGSLAGATAHMIRARSRQSS